MKTGTEKSAKRSVGEVDRKIGALIRIRRLEMEMSQATLAKAIGVTFQQIQKYERGANRIAAGTLIEIARTLEIEMSALLPAASSPNPALASLLEDAKMEELTRAWARLSEDGRCTLVGIAKALANEKRMTRKPR